MRVASFNMQFGQVWCDSDPDHAPLDLDQTLEAVRALEADVLFLQEVERVLPGQGQIDPPPNFTRLQAALPGYQACFAYPPPDERELPFGYGLAIFTRGHLRQWEALSLPAPDLQFEFSGQTTRPTQRVLLDAQVELEGRLVRLVNVHLQAFFVIHRTSDDFPQQRNRVAEIIARQPGPLILAGDLNSAPGEGTLAALEATGLRTVQRAETTWKRQPYVLDHILHSPHFAVRQHTIIPTPAADHNIVLADLAWRPN